MSQSHAKALVLRVACTFSNIKTMDEESVANICRILPSIEPMVAHQHMKAVNTAREKCNAPRIASESSADDSTRSFDRGHRGRPTPTCPPSVRRIKTLDQHRAGLTLHSDPRPPVHPRHSRTSHPTRYP